MNFLAILVAALIPLVIGFVWYNPKVFGTAWMKAAGLSTEDVEGGNMPLIFGLAFVLAILFSVGLSVFVIHQGHIQSLLFSEPGFGDASTEIGAYYADFMEKYGMKHRTFGHGAFHGAIGGFFLAMPVLATNAIFERKGFKYVAINAGYWIVTAALMGGLISAWV